MNLVKNVTYAQNREDLLLSGFFDDSEIGFYVDVGAEAPDDLSVTKLFYDKGWRGINIEPIERQYNLFVESRERDINLNIGVADKAGVRTFREYDGSGYSTFSEEMKKEHVDDDEQFVKNFRDYKIPVKSLNEIFKEQAVSSIQFLKVDVEGLEYEVLAGNNWKKYRPEVICIEANHINKDWRGLLGIQGYSFVFFDGLNEYYTDNNTDRISKFNYVKAIIYKEPILHFSLLPEIIADEDERHVLAETNKRLTQEIEAANTHIQTLKAHLDDVTPLRRHVLKSFKKRLVSVDHKLVSLMSHSTDFTPPVVDYVHPGEDKLKQAARIDHANLQAYAQQRRDNPLLPIYMKVKRVSHRGARRLVSRFGGNL